MTGYTPEDRAAALRPIESLLSKSSKAVQKVALGTWQHRMLSDNIAALQIAEALIAQSDTAAGQFSETELHAAKSSIADMIRRTEAARGKFEAGSSQHSLQRNRLAALRVAEAAVSAQLPADASA